MFHFRSWSSAVIYLVWLKTSVVSAQNAVTQCSAVQNPTLQQQTINGTNVRINDQGFYEFIGVAIAPDQAGHAIVFGSGQGLRSTDDTFCFLVHGHKFGVYKGSTSKPLWERQENQEVSIRFVRTTTGSSIRVEVIGVEVAERTHQVRSNTVGVAWSFGLDDDGNFMYITDDNLDHFITECTFIQALVMPAGNWEAPTVERIGFPDAMPVASQYINIDNNRGLRSANMKYCMHVQNSAVKFFDGYHSKKLLDIPTGYVVLLERNDQNQLFFGVGATAAGPILFPLTISADFQGKALNMPDSATIHVTQHNAPGTIHMRISDIFIQNTFKTPLDNIAAAEQTPTAITLPNSATVPGEVTISFKNGEGALFSPGGTFALAIVDNVLSFWDLQQAEGAHPVGKSIYLPKNSELRLVRRANSNAIDAKLIIEGSVAFNRPIIDGVDNANPTTLTLQPDTLVPSGIPALLFTRGAAPGINFNLDIKTPSILVNEDLMNIAAKTRCQRKRILFPTGHVNELKVVPVGSRRMSKKLETGGVLFSPEDKFCLILEDNKFGVYDAKTDIAKWEHERDSVGPLINPSLLLEVTGRKVQLKTQYRNAPSRPATSIKSFSQTFPNHGGVSLTLNADGLLTITDVKGSAYALQSEDLMTKTNKQAPRGLKCKTGNVQYYRTNIRFDTAKTYSIRTPGGLVTSDVTVCLIMEEGLIQAYSDSEGKTLWEISGTYESELKFEQTETAFTVMLTYAVGDKYGHRRESKLFEIETTPGTSITFTKSGSLRVSSPGGNYIIDDDRIRNPSNGTLQRKETKCHQVLNLPAQYLENARFEGTDVVLQPVTAGQQSSLTLPTSTAGTNHFYGLKAADNSVCMFIEAGMFSLFDEEAGKYSFQDKYRKIGKQEVKIVRSTDRVLFYHGSELRGAVSWPNTGPLLATFNEKSEFILKSPSKSMVVDNSDFAYVLKSLNGLPRDMVLAFYDKVMSEDLQCSIGHEGGALKLRDDHGRSVNSPRLIVNPAKSSVVFSQGQLIVSGQPQNVIHNFQNVNANLLSFNADCSLNVVV